MQTKTYKKREKKNARANTIHGSNENTFVLWLPKIRIDIRYSGMYVPTDTVSLSLCMCQRSLWKFGILFIAWASPVSPSSFIYYDNKGLYKCFFFFFIHSHVPEQHNVFSCARLHLIVCVLICIFVSTLRCVCVRACMCLCLREQKRVKTCNLINR